MCHGGNPQDTSNIICKMGVVYGCGFEMGLPVPETSFKKLGPMCISSVVRIRAATTQHCYSNGQTSLYNYVCYNVNGLLPLRGKKSRWSNKCL